MSDLELTDLISQKLIALDPEQIKAQETLLVELELNDACIEQPWNWEN